MRVLSGPTSFNVLSTFFISIFGFAILILLHFSIDWRHGDTTAWLNQIQVFQKEGFVSGLHLYTGYPPIPQIGWWLLSRLNLFGSDVFYFLPSMVLIFLSYLFLYRQIKSRFLAFFLSFLNPFFLFTSVSNLYTDIYFLWAGLWFLRGFEKPDWHKQLPLKSTLLFLFKPQVVYLLLLVLLFQFKNSNGFFRRAREAIPSLLIALVVLVLTFLPLGTNKRGYKVSLINGELDLIRGQKVVFAQTFNIPSLVYVVKNGFTAPVDETNGWGWPIQFGDGRSWFRLLAVLSGFGLIGFSFIRTSLRNFFLLGISVYFLLAPNLYSNNYGMIFPILFFLMDSKVPQERGLGCASMFFWWLFNAVWIFFFYGLSMKPLPPYKYSLLPLLTLFMISCQILWIIWSFKFCLSSKKPAPIS